MSRQEALALLTVHALFSLYLRDMGGTRCDENLEAGVRLDTAERVSATFLLIFCLFNLTGVWELAKGTRGEGGEGGKAQFNVLRRDTTICLHQLDSCHTVFPFPLLPKSSLSPLPIDHRKISQTTRIISHSQHLPLHQRTPPKGSTPNEKNPVKAASPKPNFHTLFH